MLLLLFPCGQEREHGGEQRLRGGGALRLSSFPPPRDKKQPREDAAPLK